MVRNVGKVDRIIRLIAAIVLIDLAASRTITGYVSVIVWIMGGILLVTALIGFCPMYSLFNIHSCSQKKISH
jgi:Protein of unknown function (DUF2892)